CGRRRGRAQPAEHRRAMPSRARRGRIAHRLRGRPGPQERAAQAGGCDLTGAARRWVIDFLLLGAIWGSSFLFTRMGAVAFGPVLTAFVRVAIASLFLLPLCAWHGQLPVVRARWKKIFLIGAFNSAFPFICFAFALLTIT